MGMNSGKLSKPSLFARLLIKVGGYLNNMTSVEKRTELFSNLMTEFRESLNLYPVNLVVI